MKCPTSCEGQIRYGIYPEGGTVRAELEYTQDDANFILWNVLEHTDTKLCSVYVEAPIEGSYRAKAKVLKNSTDVFDAEEGKRIARSKLLNSYHKAIDSKIREAIYDLRCYLASLEHYCDKKGIDYSTVEDVSQLKTKRFATPNRGQK